MTSDTSHSFDTCPLRSSSLLIVHHDQQVIVTASDEVFDMLGYHSDQLIGQPLSLLSLSTAHGKKHQVAKARHALTRQWVNLTICIHHDPFSTSSGLDYCLLAAINQQDQKHDTSHLTTVSLLGLNAYGSIVHAYPSPQFPQSSPCHLVGRPIMSFIHTDDVRPLCRLLRKSTNCTTISSTFNNNNNSNNTAKYTMDVRWLKSSRDSDAFEWMQITIVNPTMYSHVPALNGRPICLLRPVHHTKSSYASDTLDLIWAALDSGRLYCLEFAQHLLACFMQLIQDLTMITAATTTRSLPLQQPSTHYIKVNNGTSVHLVPLIPSISTFSSSSNSDSLFYLISSLLSYTMPSSLFSDRTLLDLLKPILPQTKSPSSPL
ncbi:hypothetical protein [Absidia glauca]|uniref:PAS domain-containing protein n=1 Tax=Absidia glauca TaxID=4829 RepID=A0A163MSW9_ABSGL|nr:hypothetical protein [Absidia glauca]